MKKLFVVFVVIAFALMATACGNATPDPKFASSSSASAQSSVAPQTGSVSITGAGATFPNPLYSRWFYDYASVDKSAKFNYQSIGSGGGISAITSKTVDFGASDAILTDAQSAAAPGLQMFPTVAGAIVPVYNLKDADGKQITEAIKFSYTALADIYLGKIKKWDDPALKGANPNIKLPSKDIAIVRRSDGSGTTFAFTDYLSQISDEWKTKVGSATSVKWIVEGLGGKGNEGVTAMVSQNDGTLGYVEYAYAKQNNLTYGTVQNKAGNYVTATPEAVQADMTDFGTALGDKLAVSIANGAGKDSWPISTYTYLLIYMDQADCTKGKKVVEFVKWAVTDANAQKTAQSLDYITLPTVVRDQVIAKLNKVTCQGKPF